MNRTFLLLIFLVYSVLLHAQNRITPTQYIDMYKNMAISNMKKTGVPASITLAQGMFESDYGNSPLAINANNHFGIKCHKEWTGPTYIQDDDTQDECFRKYKSVEDSYHDHAEFLKTRERYSSLFKLDITDYKGWAHGLKKAGYATNPEYAHRLIKLIEEHQLQLFDNGVVVVKENTMEQNDPLNNKVSDKPKTYITTVSASNNLSYIIAQKGDTWFKLAKANNLTIAELLNFNDATESTTLHEKEIVYLQKKNKKSPVKLHTCNGSESLRYISQLYGVKLKKIARKNKMDQDAILLAGTKVQLP